MIDRRIQWRCFHCGEAFTKAQERWAREHFGDNCDALPVCQMRVPGEHHLLTLLRKFEADAERRCAEDTDLWRALYSQSADHAAALRLEEERGYAKGVSDARAEAAYLLEALRDLVQLEGGRFGTGVIKPGTYGAVVMNAARDAIAKAEKDASDRVGGSEFKDLPHPLTTVGATPSGDE